MTDIESKFRTRGDAEAEIAAINEEIESLQDSVRDDIERLEDERAEIEEQLDDLPDEEEEKEFAELLAEEREKHDDDDA
jgi:peptidoglycan hydrolase CwlO-like protein